MRWIGKSEDGNTVTLQKLKEPFPVAAHVTPDWLKANADRVRVAAVLDVETTGLSPANSQIIEIGIRSLRFDKDTGEIVAFDAAYNGLQDPGEPLSAEIQALTGLSDDILRGQSIDWPKVTSVLENASVVIAHNAAFDRGFVDLRVPVSRSKVWACSFRQVDWRAKGFTSQKLEYLAILHGFFMDAHRALADADALAYLLSLREEASGKHYMLELIENARRTQLHVVASGSPFESKDALRRRGYAWDAAAKAWHKYLYEDDWETERAWLESAAVYNGSFRGRCHALALSDNFKQGGGA